MDIDAGTLRIKVDASQVDALKQKLTELGATLDQTAQTSTEAGAGVSSVGKGAADAGEHIATTHGKSREFREGLLLLKEAANGDVSAFNLLKVGALELQGVIGAGMALGVGVAIAALVFLAVKIKETIDKHEELKKASETLDLKYEDLKTYSDGMLKLAFSLDEVAKGYKNMSAEQAQAADKLGIDRKQISDIKKDWEVAKAGASDYAGAIENFMRLTGKNKEEAIKAAKETQDSMLGFWDKFFLQMAAGQYAQAGMIKEADEAYKKAANEPVYGGKQTDTSSADQINNANAIHKLLIQLSDENLNHQRVNNQLEASSIADKYKLGLASFNDYIASIRTADNVEINLTEQEKEHKLQTLKYELDNKLILQNEYDIKVRVITEQAATKEAQLQTETAQRIYNLKIEFARREADYRNNIANQLAVSTIALEANSIQREYDAAVQAENNRYNIAVETAKRTNQSTEGLWQIHQNNLQAAEEKRMSAVMQKEQQLIKAWSSGISQDPRSNIVSPQPKSGDTNPNNAETQKAWTAQLQTADGIRKALEDQMSRGKQNVQVAQQLLAVEKQIHDLELERANIAKNGSPADKEKLDAIDMQIAGLRETEQGMQMVDKESRNLAGSWDGIKASAKGAFATFGEGATDFASQIGDITTKGLNGMSDSLATLATTGKSTFKDLAMSIITDIEKMITKWLVFTTVKMIAESFGMGGISGQASGGYAMASAGRMIDSPEITQYANGSSLMRGENGAEVTFPVKRLSDGRMGIETNASQSAGSSGGGVSMGNIYVNYQARDGENKNTDMREMSQLLRAQMRNILRDESRRGGMLNPVRGA